MLLNAILTCGGATRSSQMQFDPWSLRRRWAKAMNRRMLVTGADGMVGSDVRGVFAEWDLILTDVSGSEVLLDVRDSSAVSRLVEENHPDYVLHLAAATDVDRCEQDHEWAYH